MFSGRWRVPCQSGGGNRLDRCYNRPDERMDNPILSRETFSSLSNAWHGRKKQLGGKLFLRRKGLLSGWLSCLAAISGGLPIDEATARGRCLARRLLFGSCPENKTPRIQ